MWRMFILTVVMVFSLVGTAFATVSTLDIIHGYEIDEAQQEANREVEEMVLAILKDSSAAMVSVKDAETMYKDIWQHMEYMLPECNSEEEPVLLLEEKQARPEVWRDLEKLVKDRKQMEMEYVFWPSEEGEKYGWLFSVILQ